MAATGSTLHGQTTLGRRAGTLLLRSSGRKALRTGPGYASMIRAQGKWILQEPSEECAGRSHDLVIEVAVRFHSQDQGGGPGWCNVDRGVLLSKRPLQFYAALNALLALHWECFEKF